MMLFLSWNLKNPGPMTVSDDWPDDALESVRLLTGIKAMVKDKNDTRLVVTYDRRKVQVSNITNRFGRHNVKVILLNQVNHLQHEATMKDEEEDY